MSTLPHQEGINPQQEGTKPQQEGQNMSCQVVFHLKIVSKNHETGRIIIKSKDP